MTILDIASPAAALDQAALAATPTAQLSAAQPLTLAQAYEIQHEVVRRRCARGDSVSGVKLGFTSRAKALQMGVSDVIIGQITRGMEIPDGGVLNHSTLIHPRVEPEIAFRLGSDVDLADPLADVHAAVDAVAPALEVIDSRYSNFTFSLEDVVADNTSAAGYVIGPWTPYPAAGAPDLGHLGVILEIDGEVVETGSTAAILGHPARALDALLRMSRLHSFTLPAGSVILAGAATAALELKPGAVVEVSIAGLGRASFASGGAA